MINGEVLSNTQKPPLPGQDYIDRMAQATCARELYDAAGGLAVTINDSDGLTPGILLGILTSIPTHQPEWPSYKTYKDKNCDITAHNVACFVFPAILKHAAQDPATTETFLALLEPVLATGESAKLASHASTAVSWLRQNNPDLSAPALDTIAETLSNYTPNDHQ